jgi:hypothetical protein
MHYVAERSAIVMEITLASDTLKRRASLLLDSDGTR